jgi:heptosyltransferase-1
VRKSGLPTGGKSKRVLIVRLGAMGDVLHALPAVTALRGLHPEWELGWVVEPRWAPLLIAGPNAGRRSPEMPLVDEVHRAHARGWARAPGRLKTWREIAGIRRELRQGRYDLAIDLQGAVRSAWMGRLAGAPLVGEAKPREAPARWWFSQRVATRGVHVIEQAAEIVEAAMGEGLPRPLPLPLLPRSAEAERRIADRLGGERIAVLHPGAGWGAKRWPAEYYGALARSLAEELKMQVLVNAGPGEESLAEAVVAASGGTARMMRTSLDELIALTRVAGLVVGGDTGPLHLASALGRPVVGIFGPTDPARNGPYGGIFRVLRHPGSQRDHSRRREPEAGLLTITAAEVLEAARAVMDQARRTQ